VSKARTVLGLLDEFIDAIPVDPQASGYLSRLSGDLFGTTNLQKVKADFNGPRRLWSVLGRDSDSVVKQLPTRDEFDEALRPWLVQESSRIRKADALPAGDYELSPRLGAAGLEKLPDIDPAKLDKAVIDRVRQGDVDGAVDALYTQMVNVARQTPASMVSAARRRGGKPIFYPVRAERNAMWSEATGLPRRAIGRASSINSAQAGPYVEEARTLAIMPFLRTADDGTIFFDYKAAEKVLGPQALKLAIGTADQPGAAQAMVNVLNNPDYLNQGAQGLAAKTWVYDILEADPNNPLALVADTIGAGARAGTKAALPSGSVESLYGQIPERALAQILGINPSAAQEIDWFVSRILRGESASSVPFSRIVSPTQVDDIAAGRKLLPPHSTNPSGDSVRDLSNRLVRNVTGKRGQLVDPEVQEVAQANSEAFTKQVRRSPELQAQYQMVKGEPVPNRSNVDNIIKPKDRARMGERVRGAIEAIDKLGPNASASAVAAVLVAFGFSNLDELREAA
jgi:hypothetical protein